MKNELHYVSNISGVMNMITNAIAAKQLHVTS